MSHRKSCIMFIHALTVIIIIKLIDGVVLGVKYVRDAVY